MKIAGIPISCENCGREFTPRRPEGVTTEDKAARDLLDSL